MRHDVSTPLTRARHWRIFIQRSVRSNFVVIARIGLQHPPQMRLAQYDHVVDELAMHRPDQAFGKRVLPRRVGQWACHGCPWLVTVSRSDEATNRGGLFGRKDHGMV